MTAVDEELRTLDLDLDRLRKLQGEIKADLNDRKNENNESQKYEMLFQRDQEMTAFLDTFAVKKEHEMKAQFDAKETIVALLEHISSSLAHEKNLPDKEKFDEMKEDLSFKSRQLETAQVCA